MSHQQSSRRQWYVQYDKYLSWALIADAVLFVLYLLFAGLGITGLKVTAAVLVFIVSPICLASLYLTGEIVKRRSRYLLVGFCAIVLCLLVSLICRYPAPAEAAKAAAFVGGMAML